MLQGEKIKSPKGLEGGEAFGARNLIKGFLKRNISYFLLKVNKKNIICL